MIHLKYLKYVLKHKWYVFWAGWKLANDWQELLRLLPRLVVHDWSKLTPREWLPYARFFYGKYPKWNDVHGDARNFINRYHEDVAADFKIAWNHHQKTNDHHWQYWLLVNDSAEPKIQPLDMPDIAIKEMVADWVGAGFAITGKIEVADWYRKNYDKIILSERTRERVDFLVNFAQGLLEEYSSDYFTKESAPVPRRDCYPVNSGKSNCEAVPAVSEAVPDVGGGNDSPPTGSDLPE